MEGHLRSISTNKAGRSPCWCDVKPQQKSYILKVLCLLFNRLVGLAKEEKKEDIQSVPLN